MTRLAEVIPHARPFGDEPLRRATVDAAAWERLAVQVAAASDWSMLAHWAEPGAVHLALFDHHDNTAAVATLPCPNGRFPSVGRHHAPAIRLERTIHDLYGLVPEHAPDGRPWLDHGRWPNHQPLAAEPKPAAAERAGYPFLAVDGESLHQIAVGPVHAGIIEPGHFRFTANGETVVRLEERLGYVHKGLEGLFVGADLGKAAQLAGRLSGDSTVATALAFVRAVESAVRVNAPARAHWLRALMGELERLANHLGDIGAVCNDAAFTFMHAQCTELREYVLRACKTAFGHRLMMDRIVPGGVACDLSPAGSSAIDAALDAIRGRFRLLVELYDDTPSLQDRTVGTGRISAELVARFGAGGFIGRAAGRAFDARRAIHYAPYDALTFDVPVRTGGDVNDRVWIRILEVSQSLNLIEQLVARMPAGPLTTAIGGAPDGKPAREGIALVEGFRGDIFAFVRVDSRGNVARCHLRDPSWFQWPLLEVAVDGNIVADFPLCNKSFNCSYSGHDV
jgi:Ni,Fe-hydrogenase III large subunit